MEELECVKAVGGGRNSVVSSDEEDDNPEHVLDEWLTELDVLSAGLNTSAESKNDSFSSLLRPLSHEITAPRIDSYRFSMANLEETQDVDLDAILGELCALGNKYDEEIGKAAANNIYTKISAPNNVPTSETNHIEEHTPNPLSHSQHRTDSPDNDSAFSDTLSMLSGESSASSGVSSALKCQNNLANFNNQKDATSQLKAEKIRLALEKMKEASVKKLFIKAYSMDGSSKSLLIDEKMTCGYVTRLLADKNHVRMEPKWALVEQLNDLYMERVYEDHELLVDNLLLWTRDSKNKLFFTEKPQKITFFSNPEQYLFSEKEMTTEYDDHSRAILLEEFFSQSLKVDGEPNDSFMINGAGNPVPHMEGPLYLKSDSKKGWKKYHFVIRSSGLYYFPKEKGRLLKDLVCLAKFDVNEIYIGMNWKKKFKAPTDYCFAIKHPKLQQAKSVKYIKFLCAEDYDTLDKWVVAMKVAKYGRQLYNSYRTLTDELAHDDIDQLAQARSFSVVSISKEKDSPNHSILDNSQNQPIYNGGSISSGSDISAGRISRTSSSSSSGCLSDGPYESEGNAFDSECSTGTIKRKPSMKPNIPLTNMTRQLKEMVELASSQNSVNSDHSAYSSSSTGYTKTGTLTRGQTRQMSNQNNDDNSIGSGTLKRHTQKPSQGSIESPSRNPQSRSSTPVLVSSVAPRQSPSPIIASHNKSLNGGAADSSGVLMGYVTNQTVKLPWLTQNGHPSINATDINSSHEQDNADFDLPLPPPPYSETPDVMFSSTFSLDALPLPPANHMDDISASQLSLANLPPPPHPNEMLLPPPMETAIKSEMTIYEKIKEANLSNNIYSTPQPPNYLIKPNAVSPPIQEHYKNTVIDSGPHISSPIILRRNLNQQREDNSSVILRNSTESFSPTSPSKKGKKISFNLPSFDANTSPSKPALPQKPPPPLRNESTRLSTLPKRLSDSASNPPVDFLKDLQRVMRKKWQVAQKCKLEPTTTPHEILGFREYPLQIEDYKEMNVSNWVQEHYGHVGVVHSNVDNLYENVNKSVSQSVSGLQRNSDIRMSLSKKKPPPPPPKRSENTQLTTVQPQKFR